MTMRSLLSSVPQFGVLRAPGSVARALAVVCPLCRERPGHPCQREDGKPVVHDVRESVAFNGKRIWT